MIVYCDIRAGSIVCNCLLTSVCSYNVHLLLLFTVPTNQSTMTNCFHLDHHHKNGIIHLIRNRRRSHTMKIHIPGLHNIIDIPFPDGNLPVCTPCKAMFKSREHCRLRDGHTYVLWIKTYVCVILDDSCITQNSNGGLRLVNEDDVQFSARLISGTITYTPIERGDVFPKP